MGKDFDFDSLGIQEWTPEEENEKDAAIAAGASRRLVSVLRSQVPDEFAIVDIDGSVQEADLAWSIDAMNHLLALLNFPNKLKPFLDSILGTCGSSGTTEFVATNWEIGQRSRSGRNACSDRSMEKWVSRQKKQLDEWMAYKSFRLVRITPGEYDFEINKRKPTRYEVFFNQYVVKTVNLAKTKFYWKASAHGRKLQGRALREAARQVLQEIPEAPNLRLQPVKTLSEEEKFDRRHKQILTFMGRNRDALAKVGLDPNAYFMYLVGEADKIATNPTGSTGKILTPEADEPNRHISVWQKIKSGDINHEIEKNDEHLETKIENLEAVGFDTVEYAAQSVLNETEPRVIDSPRYWKDGKFVETDQRFGSAPQAEMLNTSASDNLTEEFSAPINEEHRDILGDLAKPLETKSKSIGTFLSVCSENSGESNGTNTATNGTNLSGSDADFDEMFNTIDWKSEAEQGIPDYSEDDLHAICKNWSQTIAEKIPDAPPSELNKGIYQIYWGEVFSESVKATENKLAETIQSIAEGSAPIDALKTVYADWIVSRVSYYKHGVPVHRTVHENEPFRERLLEKIILLPGEENE